MSLWTCATVPAGTPVVLQVAASGEWERAEVLPLAGEPDPERAYAVVERVARAHGHAAVELLWAGYAFVGTGWQAADLALARAAIARVCATAPLLAPQAGLAALLGRAPGHEARFAALGAVNAWRSVGAETLWRRGEAYSRDAVDAVLARRPDLTMCTHPVAVEFGLEGDSPAWAAVYVSSRVGEGHRVDPERLDAALRAAVPPPPAPRP